MPHLTPTHVSLSRLRGSVRITGRRIALRWSGLPSWMQAGIYAVALLVWLRYALIVVLA